MCEPYKTEYCKLFCPLLRTSCFFKTETEYSWEVLTLSVGFKICSEVSEVSSAPLGLIKEQN